MVRQKSLILYSVFVFFPKDLDPEANIETTLEENTEFNVENLAQDSTTTTEESTSTTTSSGQTTYESVSYYTTSTSGPTEQTTTTQSTTSTPTSTSTSSSSTTKTYEQTATTSSSSRASYPKMSYRPRLLHPVYPVRKYIPMRPMLVTPKRIVHKPRLMMYKQQPVNYVRSQPSMIRYTQRPNPSMHKTQHMMPKPVRPLKQMNQHVVARPIFSRRQN